ncbi:MAG: GH3 auxin-responsive promoter family protein, partial [Haliscomenobacter sp.]
VFQPNPPRVSLRDVQLGVNYALIVNSNAGLWGYNIGDTVEFVSLNPYRIRVTGRIKHFISAFGEHVIGKEVDEAMLATCRQTNIRVVEYTVAPQVNPPDGSAPYHEWFVEFDTIPEDLEAFSQRLNQEMVHQNIYYQDLIDGKILQPLRIRPLQRDAFREFMKKQGKLGGQNKVPRLANDRTIAEALESSTLTI